MFDAGAVVGKMILDRKEWNAGMQAVQKNVEDLKDRATRMSRQISTAVTNVSQGFTQFGNSVRQAGNEIRRAGMNLAFFGAALAGPLLLAFNSMKNISPQVAAQVQRLTNVTQQFQLQVANAMVPVVERLVNVLGGLLQAFNSLDPALRTQIVQWTLVGGVVLTVGGLFLSTAGKFLSLVGSFLKLSGAVIGFLGPWGLVAAAVLVVVASFGKLDEVARFTLNAIETAAYAVLTAILALGNGMLASFESATFALQKFYQLLGKIPGAIGEPYRNAAAGIDQFRDKLRDMINTNVTAIEVLKTKSAEAFSGNGELARALDLIIAKYGDIESVLKNLGKVNVDTGPLLSSFNAIGQAWQQTAQGMVSMFGNLFVDGITNKLKNMKQIFADFGRSVLNIIGQVIARLLLARALGSIGGPIGAAFAGLAGHADGIDEVPSSGLYRLHAGERVVPKYDAGKSQPMMIQIQNLITNDTIAAAMSSRPGKNTIVNVIRADANQRGPTRHTMRGN